MFTKLFKQNNLPKYFAIGILGLIVFYGAYSMSGGALLGDILNSSKDPVIMTYIESTENLQKLQSYKTDQNISGKFQFKIPTITTAKSSDEITGNYRFNFAGNVYNNKPYESDAHINFNGNINLNMKGDAKYFDSLIVNIRGQIKYMLSDGFYASIDDVSFSAKGVPKDDTEDYEAFKKQIDSMITPLKGQWIYIPESYLNTLPGGSTIYKDQKTLMENIKKKGLVTFYKDLLKDVVATEEKNGGITKDESAKLKKLVDEFFKTQFFSKKAVESGTYKGYYSFYIHKERVMDFIVKIAAVLDEKLTQAELAKMRKSFNKFDLSGRYNVDKTNKIVDNTNLNFTLKNISVLSNLELSYTSKVSDVNKGVKVTKPATYKTVDELASLLLGF